MAAARETLDAQKKASEHPEQLVSSDANMVYDTNDDIYADIRNETDNNDRVEYDENTDEYTINYSPDPQSEPGIDFNYYEEPDPEIDPSDVPIYEGGPPVSFLDAWKKQYTKEAIMHTQILDKDYTFRTLNRYEYKQIVAIENIDALYREEIICKTCVLWPRNYDFKKMAQEPAGYVSTLAEIIMENSGCTKNYGIEVL